jgi:hypothetical protein
MEMTDQPNKNRRVTIYGVVALVSVLALVSSLRVSGTDSNGAMEVRLKNELSQVQTAVLCYLTEYNVYPAATNNAAFVKILTGATKVQNSRGIEFLSIKPSDMNAKGELLDPWGTPLQLSLTPSGKLQARSAGPDKTIGTADDISGDINLGAP